MLVRLVRGLDVVVLPPYLERSGEASDKIIRLIAEYLRMIYVGSPTSSRDIVSSPISAIGGDEDA